MRRSARSLRSSGFPSLPPPVPGLGAMDATALERDAVQFARLAVQRDHEGRYSEAVFYYKVERGDRCTVYEARGRVQVPRRPGPLSFAFPSSCSVALLCRGEATRAPATVGGFGSGLGATTSLVTVLDGQCPPLSYAWQQ